MRPLFIHTVFDPKTNKPRCTGILHEDTLTICELFQDLTGNPILPIMENIKKIRSIIQKSELTRPVVITNFQKHIQAFNLDFSNRRVNIYDPQLPKLPTDSDADKDKNTIKRVLEKLSSVSLKPYQNIYANAQIAYQDMSINGITINHIKFYPQWSVDTFTGRSKTQNPNIQGWHENSIIRSKGYDERDVLVHFDWICADIRMVSLLSGDQKLSDSFISSDPYEQMMHAINEGSEVKITRQESKHLLLKSINSMDITSLVFTDIYPDLGTWIMRSKRAIESDGALTSILGKRFKIQDHRNNLSVLNGVMQGSVAHGMQNVIRKIWEKFPTKIVAEIHDSLVVASSSNSAELMATIKAVSDIMTRPFEGYLDENPFFPLKVSLGKKWRKWKPLYIIRENGKLSKTQDQHASIEVNEEL